MSHVLVTGGAGFIGSHLVEALLARSYRVRVLDNLSQGRREYLPHHSKLEFIEGDVTDYATCRDAMRDVDGVFHLAAMSKVLPSLDNPDMIDFCTHQNVVGTSNVLRAAVRHTDRIKKLIYSASSTYYGTNSPPHAEDQPPACQTPYAMTKYVGELYCELFSRLHGLPTIRLRYFMTYGPRQPSSGPYAIVTGVFMKQWQSRQSLTILGDGSQTRDFIHVQDIAEGTVVAFESGITDATINIGTGRSLSIKALADLISSEQVFLPKREHDIPHQQADTSRMRRLLNWEPKRDLGEYLKSVIRNQAPPA
jgi:nucleoside-diphosphate-sugar epimerase